MNASRFEEIRLRMAEISDQRYRLQQEDAELQRAIVSMLGVHVGKIITLGRRSPYKVQVTRICTASIQTEEDVVFTTGEGNVCYPQVQLVVAPETASGFHKTTRKNVTYYGETDLTYPQPGA